MFRLVKRALFSLLKMCRLAAGAGAFALKCERFLIVQPAKDSGFLRGRLPARLCRKRRSRKPYKSLFSPLTLDTIQEVTVSTRWATEAKMVRNFFYAC